MRLPATFFELFFPRVTGRVRALAKLTNLPIPMALTAKQTIDLLRQIYDKYVALQTKLDAAVADLEPARAENARINAALTTLQAEDAEQDTALEAIRDALGIPAVEPAPVEPLE